MPRLLNPLRRIRLPTSPSLLAVAALQSRSSQSRAAQGARVSSNIQPFTRRARQQAAPQLVRAAGGASQAGVASVKPHAATVEPSQQQSPAAAETADSWAASPTHCQRWHLRLRGGIAAGISAAARIAGSPLRAANTYQPFGHEVFLVSPADGGQGLHAAVLEGMQRSLVCPTAHRMPSYRYAARSRSIVGALPVHIA